MIDLISVSNRKTHEKIEIWPKASKTNEDFFFENQEYIFEIASQNSNLDLELLIDDTEVLALKATKNGYNRWLWCPDFFAGSIELEVHSGGRRIFAKKLILSPSKAKLTYSDFELMLAQILTETSSLFSLGQTKVSIEAGRSYSTPITKLEYLRNNFDALSRTLSAIIECPVTTLRADVEYISPEKYTGSVDGSRVSQAFGLFGAVEFSGGYIPARLPIDRKSHQTNIYEHQCIKKCLLIWSSWLRQIGRSIKSSNNINSGVANKWAKRAFELSYRLDRILSEGFFDNVGELQDVGIQPTNIFTTVPHYRKFFDLQRKLNLGIGKSLGDFLEMPISKTYQLYELWCFFRIISALKLSGNMVQKVGLRKANTDLGESNILFEVQFDGFLLSFQKRFDEYWKSDDGLGSFSRTMIPDISIKIDESAASVTQVIVFDAKYRVDLALNDAISSAHMYQDAIVSESVVNGSAGSVDRRVIGSYLLTPAVPDGFCNAWKDEPAPRRFFHPSFVDAFKFGVLSLHPRMPLERVASTMAEIVTNHK